MLLFGLQQLVENRYPANNEDILVQVLREVATKQVSSLLETFLNLTVNASLSETRAQVYYFGQNNSLS